MIIFGSSSSHFNDINTHKNYYSKFYTSSHPKLYYGGKKYEVERKHKVKKRELYRISNDKIDKSSGDEVADQIIRRDDSFQANKGEWSELR